MKLIKYLVVGILFGIVMTKSEAVSWFRIQEMFRFESFHMYGIIGTAVILGAIVVATIKKYNGQTIAGERIKFNPKSMSIPRYLIGGGPMFTLLGQGVWSMLLVILSAIVGTYVYGIVRAKLPH